jgi:outer membrane protein assembly factor BamB
VGDSNGALYLLNANLVLQWTYDGQADGHPAITSTPAADSNGDWYFGADDGYVYDVELPATGSQLFKAARFGPGGAVLSSPIVSGCGSGPCIYFASSTAGSYFVRLGGIRVMDLRACVSTSSSSTNCANNPRLWARVEVGSPAVLGGRGVFVQGWSFYSP